MIEPVASITNQVSPPRVGRTILNNLLEEAVDNRDISSVRTLIARGADPACRAGRAFHKACTTGFAEAVALLFGAAREQNKPLDHLLEQCLDLLVWDKPGAYEQFAEKYKLTPCYHLSTNYTAKMFSDQDRKNWKHPETVDLLFSLGGKIEPINSFLEVMLDKLNAFERSSEGRYATDYLPPTLSFTAPQKFEDAVSQLMAGVTWRPAHPRTSVSCHIDGVEAGSYSRSFINGLRARDAHGVELLHKITHLCASMAASWDWDGNGNRLFAPLLTNELRHLQEMSSQHSSNFSIAQYITQLLGRSEKLKNFPDVVQRVGIEIYLTSIIVDNPPEIVRNLRDERFEKIARQAYAWALSHLTANRSLGEIIKLNLFMHAPVNALPIQNRPFFSNLR